MNWVIIGPGNGLSPVRHQAITWTNAGLLSIRPLGTNFSEIRIKTQKISFKEMHLKMLSAKQRPFCPGGDELSTANRNYLPVTVQSLPILCALPIGPRHFSDNIFKCIFFNGSFCISFDFSLNFTPKGLIDNKSSLVQVMACLALNRLTIN